MAKTVWNIDPTHSEIGFKVKHMMFTNVSGKFNDFTSTIVNDQSAFENSDISFTAKVSSVDTNNTDRDNHLRSADFFEVDKYEELGFKSSSIQKKSDHEYVITGMLTIKDITKEISLNAQYSGLLTDPWGNTKIALSLEGNINRKEFGLKWNTALETGGVLVGEDIKLLAEVQFTKS